MDEILEYRKKITSQDGEDGVLLEIFKRLEVEKGVCVEFGAWDGKHLSNTWNLWNNEGWRSVLIEGDEKKFIDLKNEYGEHENLTLVCKYVEIEGDASLDAILLETDIPKDFDLLSIDIDGDDYHVWKHFNEFRPKVVIIEHNPSIPPSMELVDTPNSREFGASALSMLKLAQEKKYVLVACTRTNMIFIKKELFCKLSMEDVELDKAFQYDHIQYIIGSYSGRAFLSKKARPAHITTSGLLSFRSFLPSEIPVASEEYISPAFVCDISKLKNNKFFIFCASVLSKLF